MVNRLEFMNLESKHRAIQDLHVSIALQLCFFKRQTSTHLPVTLKLQWTRSELTYFSYNIIALIWDSPVHDLFTMTLYICLPEPRRNYAAVVWQQLSSGKLYLALVVIVAVQWPPNAPHTGVLGTSINYVIKKGPLSTIRFRAIDQSTIQYWTL